MHYFDMLVFVIVGLFALAGIRRGLVAELLKIVGLVVAILIAIEFADLLAAKIAGVVNASQESLVVISFILIILGIMLLFRIAVELLQRILHYSMLGWVDRLGGAMFGAVKATIIVSLLLWGLLFLPMKQYTQDLQDNTATYSIILGVAPAIYNGLVKVFPGTEQFLQRIEDYLPINAQDTGMVRNYSPSSLEKLKTLLDDEFDTDILESLSEERIRELLNDPDLLEEWKQKLSRQQGAAPALWSIKPGARIAHSIQ